MHLRMKLLCINALLVLETVICFPYNSHTSSSPEANRRTVVPNILRELHRCLASSDIDYLPTQQRNRLYKIADHLHFDIQDFSDYADIDDGIPVREKIASDLEYDVNLPDEYIDTILEIVPHCSSNKGQKTILDSVPALSSLIEDSADETEDDCWNYDCESEFKELHDTVRSLNTEGIIDDLFDNGQEFIDTDEIHHRLYNSSTELVDDIDSKVKQTLSNVHPLDAEKVSLDTIVDLPRHKLISNLITSASSQRKNTQTSHQCKNCVAQISQNNDDALNLDLVLNSSLPINLPIGEELQENIIPAVIQNNLEEDEEEEDNLDSSGLLKMLSNHPQSILKLLNVKQSTQQEKTSSKRGKEIFPYITDILRDLSLIATPEMVETSATLFGALRNLIAFLTSARRNSVLNFPSLLHRDHTSRTETTGIGIILEETIRLILSRAGIPNMWHDLAMRLTTEFRKAIENFFSVYDIRYQREPIIRKITGDIFQFLRSTRLFQQEEVLRLVRDIAGALRSMRDRTDQEIEESPRIRRNFKKHVAANNREELSPSILNTVLNRKSLPSRLFR